MKQTESKSHIVTLPCKVGDKVYYIFRLGDGRILPFIREAKVKRIYCANKKMQFLIDCELTDSKEKGVLKAWFVDEFGKTIFTSEKEAEESLNNERN